jgi:cell division protein FtsQ
MNTLLGVDVMTNRWGTRSGQENRRTVRPQRPRHGWYVGVALLLLSVGASLIIGWSVLIHYVTHHSYFTISDIIIEVQEPFSQEEVQQWSGLAVGMSLWTVDPADVEARLLTHPGVRSAQVRREFPQRVYVTVSARQPVAIIVHESLTYLDDTGAWFVEDKPLQGLDLPYVSGLTGLALDTPTARDALAGVLPFLALTQLWSEPLSEIHWDQRQGYTLFLARRRVTIRLGWETAPEKFAQVAMVLTRWPSDGPPVLFDARFADQLVVRPYADERGRRAAPLRPL